MKIHQHTQNHLSPDDEPHYVIQNALNRKLSI